MSANPPSVFLETLGCSKNQVDSEKVTAVLDGAGYRYVDDPSAADVVMVNTCAFIEAARQESVDTILSMADTKRDDAKLVVLGCMAQRYETELVEALPEADAVIGLIDVVPAIGCKGGTCERDGTHDECYSTDAPAQSLRRDAVAGRNRSNHSHMSSNRNTQFLRSFVGFDGIS